MQCKYGNLVDTWNRKQTLSAWRKQRRDGMSGIVNARGRYAAAAGPTDPDIDANVALPPPERIERGLARHCVDEALHLALVVVVMHAGADERVQSARRQIERGRARRTGHVD